MRPYRGEISRGRVVFCFVLRERVDQIQGLIAQLGAE